MSAEQPPPTLGSHEKREAVRLADLPIDELRHYADELGLAVPPRIEKTDLVRRIRDRQEVLVSLDHEAMLDIMVWARRPVHRTADKDFLAREIAKIGPCNYRTLSLRGLRALAALRGVPCGPQDEPELIIAHLEKADGFWGRLAHKRRSIVGSLLSSMFEEKSEAAATEYRFLPENEATRNHSLRSEIEQRGVVGGLASRLRGVADDYVREKLDEIEVRIDRKLEEIDHRLGEWRDREIANRLKILRITLVASVLFALLSLGYHLIRQRVTEEPTHAETPTTDVARETAQSP
jgi:hypothetical protein